MILRIRKGVAFGRVTYRVIKKIFLFPSVLKLLHCSTVSAFLCTILNNKLETPLASKKETATYKIPWLLSATSFCDNPFLSTSSWASTIKNKIC